MVGSGVDIMNEIEFVLKFKTDSWIGIGWKPNDSNEYCPSWQELGIQRFWKDSLATTSYGWPSGAEKQDGIVSNEVLPSVPVDADRSSDARNLTLAITKICNENEEFTNCPEFTRQCEASCDWTRFPETIPNCPRSCGTPKCVCKEGYVRAANDNDTCVPFHFCSDEVGFF
ncbi:unnamed protein product [Gongylonema pulchrum]|uniref:ShKT domain-containing protein n=1 Tax=Gongylonema pulchrum TaxID=637853 RepID=A0A183CYZ9_9BILA|nr:unnamed protein product [Gongylonema pulchrum]